MFEDIIKQFKKHEDSEQAESMAAYMKDNFSFMGLARPVRNSLQKEFIQKARKKKEINWKFVFRCWELPEREYQYLALDYIIASRKALHKADMSKLQDMIVQKSWWDTVDIIAAKLVGELCTRYPELIDDYVLKWAGNENIWLRRSALLFQLKYKNETDSVILDCIIRENIGSKEFFINKAIGWALREYSKTSPEWVRDFMKCTELHPLSRREGGKYLK